VASAWGMVQHIPVDLRRMDRWPSAIACRQVDGGFRIGAGLVALFEPVFQGVEHICFTSSGKKLLVANLAGGTLSIRKRAMTD